MKAFGRVFVFAPGSFSTAVAACLAWATFAAGFAQAEGPADRAPRPSIRRSEAPPSRAPAGGSALAPKIVIDDVALGLPDGVLKGQLLWSPNAAQPGPVVGRTVKLLKGNQTVAVTRTDASGRFALSHLSAGMYRVVVTGPDGPGYRLCRVWTPSAAPPSARDRVDIVLDGDPIRGQGPFPFMSFQQAAAVGAVVGGAVAIPVIYHNVKTSNKIPNKVPASP